MKLIRSVFIFFIFSSPLLAQDTIKVMHYNLLYYGKNVYDCTSITNSINAKNEYLKTIIKFVKPDIFTVNELDGEDAYPINDDATYLLDNALNVDGVTRYKRTDFPEVYLANTVFYNSNKLTLKKHEPLIFTISSQKIFNVYTFYYNSPDLSTSYDTVFITCMVAHLKAGSYDEDIQERTTEAGYVMNYFTNLGQRGNYLFMGDLNLYTSTEGAFQALINPTNPLYKFYDPANQIGAWGGNYDYRFYHTQSTHTSGDCFSSGGMDDRFDFILASEYIMNGTQKALYIPDSYKTIGQDGSSYNSSFNTSSNTSVPIDVALALYKMSDHLPVYLELEIDQTPALGTMINSKTNDQVIKWSVINPAYDNLNLSIDLINECDLTVELISTEGKIMNQWIINSFSTQFETQLPIGSISKGVYLIRISSINFVQSKTIVIQ